MNIKKLLFIAPAILLVGALSACGGGSDSAGTAQGGQELVENAEVNPQATGGFDEAIDSR